MNLLRRKNHDRRGHRGFWFIDSQLKQPADERLLWLAAADSLNVRIPSEIGGALCGLGWKGKIHRVAPSTKQDIAAEALADWLKKHGYLHLIATACYLSHCSLA